MRKDRYGNDRDYKKAYNPLPNFNFNVSQKKEDLKLAKQAICPHTHFTIRCAACSLVLGSEVIHHIPTDCVHDETII